jgi:hypothetical protein
MLAVLIVQIIEVAQLQMFGLCLFIAILKRSSHVKSDVPMFDIVA